PVRGEIVQGRISPIIVSGRAVRNQLIGVVLHFLNGKKLDGGDAQILQIGSLYRRSSIAAPQRFWNFLISVRQASEMYFVDDVILQRPGWLWADAAGLLFEHDPLGRHAPAVLQEVIG